jgi:alkanesulfonate monooxygenase SsuD/methylene tetrahydromethanopterin reductase-like flavin-dependent oxidoreductase (luciferase family)
LCGITENINIGCGFNIMPTWHPLRLAEDYAMADILTGGRVIFGVGRGCHTREVETFGTPLLGRRRGALHRVAPVDKGCIPSP